MNKQEILQHLNTRLGMVNELSSIVTYAYEWDQVLQKSDFSDISYELRDNKELENDTEIQELIQDIETKATDILDKLETLYLTKIYHELEDFMEELYQETKYQRLSSINIQDMIDKDSRLDKDRDYLPSLGTPLEELISIVEQVSTEHLKEALKKVILASD